MKNFTCSDVKDINSEFPRIYIGAHHEEFKYAPLAWQELGLQETASGYGRKLTSKYKISYEGKLYRLYTTIFSNAGSTWFKVKGKKIYVS